MKKVKTYWWFWGVAIFLLAFGLTIGVDSVIDIPVHDTYFVVSIGHILFLTCLVFFLFGCGYIFRKLIFNPILNVLHFFSTFLAFGLILFPMAFIGMAGKPRKYKSNTELDFMDYVQDLNNILNLGFYILIFGTIIYFINLGFAIFKSKT